MNQLIQDLAVDLPTYYHNSIGQTEPVKRPKGTMIARCGDVVLIQQTKERFAVCYCLEIKPNLSRDSSAIAFGQACIHQAECESLTRL